MRGQVRMEGEVRAPGLVDDQRRERHAGDMVALRRAVDEEPGALGAPGLGGKLLGALEGRGLRAHVDSLHERRDVERERLRAECLEHAWISGWSALVAGHVEA